MGLLWMLQGERVVALTDTECDQFWPDSAGAYIDLARLHLRVHEPLPHQACRTQCILDYLSYTSCRVDWGGWAARV